jgi:hypothetical protein
MVSRRKRYARSMNLELRTRRSFNLRDLPNPPAQRIQSSFIPHFGRVKLTILAKPRIDPKVESDTRSDTC